MDTPNANSKLAVRVKRRFFTHPHVLCQTLDESWGWGGWLVGISMCPSFGIYSRVRVSIDPFWQKPVLSQPSHIASPIRIVQMDLSCGLY